MFQTTALLDSRNSLRVLFLPSLWQNLSVCERAPCDTRTACCVVYEASACVSPTSLLGTDHNKLQRPFAVISAGCLKQSWQVQPGTPVLHVQAWSDAQCHSWSVPERDQNLHALQPPDSTAPVLPSCLWCRTRQWWQDLLTWLSPWLRKPN